MSEKIKGYLYLIAAMATVGSTVIASKIIAAGIPPFTATALRFAMALPIFIAIMFLTGKRLPRLSHRDWLLVMFQAVAGSVGFTTLLISGLSLTSAANAGIIIGTLPIVSAAIAVLLLGERPQAGIYLAIAIAASGVLAIVLQPDEGQSSLIGDILIFGAVLCEGLFILINKRLRTPVEPLALSTLVTAFGLTACMIPAALEPHFSSIEVQPALWAIAYYALVPTVAGFLFWYAGARRVSGAEASVFTSVAPVSAVLMAASFLGETISLNHVLGTGCVLLAVVGLGLSEVRSRKRPA
ncbi:MAG: putative transrane protein [Rhizobium sp.]|nr:putative transrane protein [Rhizobium sp.]